MKFVAYAAQAREHRDYVLLDLRAYFVEDTFRTGHSLWVIRLI